MTAEATPIPVVVPNPVVIVQKADPHPVTAPYSPPPVFVVPQTMPYMPTWYIVPSTTRCVGPNCPR